MKIVHVYSFIIYMLCIQASAFSIGDVINIKQVDSLLEASTKRVYVTPDKSVDIGLTIFENINYPKKTRTRALMLVSLAYTSKRDYQKALEYIEKASEFSSDLDDAVLQVEILFRTGILYQQLKIFDKSIQFLERSEQLSLIYPVRDSVGKFLANTYAVKGFIYKDNLNCDIALEYFDKSIREYEKLKSSNHKANLSIVYYNKGNCFVILSEYGNAKNSFNRSIAFAKLENANSLISFAQKGLAEVHTLQGEYEKAISLLQIALNQSEKVGDLILNLGIYKGLFENYLALNKWDDYQIYYDLYLKTQLEIKISERSSISDSIVKNSKSQNERLNSIQTLFKSQFKWIVIIVFIYILSILLMNRKNIKSIKTLRSRADAIKNTNTNT